MQPLGCGQGSERLGEVMLGVSKLCRWCGAEPFSAGLMWLWLRLSELSETTGDSG